MSHRTQDLPPASGIAAWVRELRYHEVSRQSLAVILILVYTIVARPDFVIASIGLVMAIIGTLIRLYASGFVLKNKELASTGPYALVRHPLYTGNIVLVLGFALASGAWWTIVLSVAFFWFYYPTTIEYEDRKLRSIFGSAWEQWSAKTPALLPNFSNMAGLFQGNWSFAKSTKQNGEIVIVIFIIVCGVVVARRAGIF